MHFYDNPDDEPIYTEKEVAEIRDRHDELRRKHNELVESVEWERECSMPNMAGVISQYTHHLYTTRGEDYLDEIQEEYEAIVDAARADVDKLLTIPPRHG